MKSYKIKIEITDIGGIYSASNIEEANKIAQAECDNIYSRLKNRCTVKIESVEEITISVSGNKEG